MIVILLKCLFKFPKTKEVETQRDEMQEQLSWKFRAHLNFKWAAWFYFFPLFTEDKNFNYKYASI